MTTREETRLGRLPRLSPGARFWLTAARVASPLTAVAMKVVGVVTRSEALSSGAGDVLQGRRTLVGPSAELSVRGGVVRPGVFNDFALSERMNLELSAAELDAAYLRRLGPRADFTILLRSAWSALLDRGGQAGKAPAATDHFSLFGVVVNNSETPLMLRTLEDMVRSHPNLILQTLPEAPTDPAPPVHVCFVNANNMNLALERPEYKRALVAADLVLPDGIGVKIALQMAGGRLRRNLNGTDLFPPLADLMAKNDWPVFLLGATKEVLARAADNIRRRHPGIRIAGKRDGYFRAEDEEALCREINASGAMALVIGMGTPRQELFAARNAHRLRIPVVLSMGGLIDFLGEKNRRAPLWMRQTGLEWVFRLLQEPGRMWRRYIIGNPVFLWRVSRWIRAQRRSSSLRTARR